LPLLTISETVFLGVQSIECHPHSFDIELLQQLPDTGNLAAFAIAIALPSIHQPFVSRRIGLAENLSAIGNKAGIDRPTVDDVEMTVPSLYELTS